MSITKETTAGERNQASIVPLRAKFAAHGVKHLINGEPVDALSGATFETISPVDNSAICKAASGDAADIDRAAQAAKAAFPAWRDLPAAEPPI